LTEKRAKKNVVVIPHWKVGMVYRKFSIFWHFWRRNYQHFVGWCQKYNFFYHFYLCLFTSFDYFYYII